MLSWLANAWRVPELRKRVLFTAFVLAVYRLGSWIPAPGIDQAAIKALEGSRFVQSHEKAIQELAAKARGDAKTAAQAAKKLEEAVLGKEKIVRMPPRKAS